MRFLIVDDSKAMQTIVRKTLVAAGYVDHEFQYAFNGYEALDIIKKWKPEIVLSDWYMPEMSGIELLHKVKEEGIKTKVGLVTTERSRSKVEEAKKAGALFIVSKPFNVETLHEAVEEAISGGADTEGEVKETASVLHHLILPSANNISRAINSFSRHTITVTECDGFDIDYTKAPFMTGLYEDNQKNKTASAIIFDAATVCYVGASMQDTDVKEAIVSIDNNLIPKAIFDICKSMINLIGTLYHDKISDAEFNVKAVHLVNHPEGKLKNLIKKKVGDGQCFKVSVDGYGDGRMIILKM